MLKIIKRAGLESTEYVEQILLIHKAWLYGILFFIDITCSEMMLRNVCAALSFLYIFVYNLLSFIYVSVSRNMTFLLYSSNLNLIVGCFVLSSFRNFVRSFILPVQKKNVSSMNLKWISNSLLITHLFSSWLIKIYAY